MNNDLAGRLLKSLSGWPSAGDLGKWARKCRAAVPGAHEAYFTAGPRATRSPRLGCGAGGAGSVALVA
jgi:hypothetical protein